MRVRSSEMVDDYKKNMFSGHSKAVADRNSQYLWPHS